MAAHPGSYPETRLEEINGDLLEEDFYGVIVTKVLRFFAFGTRGGFFSWLGATSDPRRHLRLAGFRRQSG